MKEEHMKNDSEYLNNLRHSCAHLLAAAVMELYPNAKRTIGPAIENGFYYDFDNLDVSENDLPAIEEKMRKIAFDWKSFERMEVDSNKAIEQFSNNEYKKELIEEFSSQGQQLTLYKSGDFVDLCRGGHVEHPDRELKHIKLLSVAGAYWRGDEKNKMLTRIYGTCFPTKEELEKYLWQQEEAKKRDHRKLGRELDLFLVNQDIGGGLPIFTPKGNILRNIVVDYIVKQKKDRDYQFVWTPHIARSNVYKKSGHWQKYDAMFSPMKLDDEEHVLKPMNCPHHFQVYLNKPRSYKELPFRIAENGTCYRYEKSGELNGLLRVRSVTIDDTHTFIRHSQTASEIKSVLTLVLDVFAKFGFADYRARISIADPNTPEKYLGDPANWKRAEIALRQGVENLKIPYEIGEGEAAFYGPKIDMMVKDSLGRSWQLSTIQLDYNQPENFDMSYIDEHGEQVRPAILHIAVLGSFERFIGVLLEHYAGAFPTWLSPVQVVAIPIAERHSEAAKKAVDALKRAGVRAEIDDRNDTMQAKIRTATLQKVPYMAIIGDRESEGATVSVRTRSGEDLKAMGVGEFIAKVQKELEPGT